MIIFSRSDLFQRISEIPRQSLHEWIGGVVLINHTLLLGSISLLQQAHGLQNMLVREGSEIGCVTDDRPFKLTKKRAKLLAGLIEFPAPDGIFLLPELRRIFFDRLIAVTGAEKNAIRWAMDFDHPLFTATLSTDRSVLGGTEPLSLSLSTQNTLHRFKAVRLV